MHRFSQLNKKQKKTTVNPINKHENKCFQYCTTVALNHREIKTKTERISKIRLFVNKCNKKKKFPSGKGGGKNSRKIFQQSLFYITKIKIYILHTCQTQLKV